MTDLDRERTKAALERELAGYEQRLGYAQANGDVTQADQLKQQIGDLRAEIDRPEPLQKPIDKVVIEHIRYVLEPGYPGLVVGAILARADLPVIVVHRRGGECCYEPWAQAPGAFPPAYARPTSQDRLIRELEAAQPGSSKDLRVFHRVEAGLQPYRGR